MNTKITDIELMQLSRCLAPVLLGVKPAALIRISTEQFALLMKLRSICPIQIYPLDTQPANQVFICIPELLEEAFRQPDALFMLRSIGYGGNKIEDYVHELIRRIQGSFDQRNLFPHEIGIFLGYPLEDVIGFWLNRGKDALFDGEWKVYADVEDARASQNRHLAAKNVVVKALNAGMDIEDILNMYWQSNTFCKYSATK